MAYYNHYDQQVGKPVPDWQGARMLERETLSGRYCTLAPLNADAHAAALYAAYQDAPDDRDWTWLASDRPDTLAQCHEWVTQKVMDPSLVPFAVIDNARGEAVGLVCFMRIDKANGVVEIGHVTWSPRMKNRVTGTEALWLLMRDAFEHGFRRVEWKCDSMNTASRRAAERLGFIYEGRLRQMMVRKGRNRDSEWFSLLDSEWPQVNDALRAWLSPENFTAGGVQKQPLSHFRASSQA
ncbi:GNAT family N-acetyltransferase [Cronobacter turicensis]